LSTTTRRIKSKEKGKKTSILLTDTVGFIEDLPSWIIDAFHSTLEEIEVADVVLLIIDGSENRQIVEKKLQVSLNELVEIGSTASVVIALNKIDLMENKDVEDVIQYLDERGLLNGRQCIPISVKNGKNIDALIENVYKSLPNLVKMTLQLPLNKDSQSFVSQLYEKTKISDVKYNHNIVVKVECNAKLKDKIISKCAHLKGSVK
jgi:GTP-binding protein HflX